MTRYIEPPWVRNARTSTLPASDRSGLVRDVPIGPRAMRRIERQRTQYQPSAGRERFDVSGRPTMSRPAIWQRLALYGDPIAEGE